MTIYTGPKAYDFNPPPSIQSAGELMVSEGYYDVPAEYFDQDDIIILNSIPAGCVIVDARLEMDILDSDGFIPTLLVNIALMEMHGSAIISNSKIISPGGPQLANNGGVMRMGQKTAAERAVLESAVYVPRHVVGWVQYPQATPEAGRMKASVWYRAAEYGEFYA